MSISYDDIMNDFSLINNFSDFTLENVRNWVYELYETLTGETHKRLKSAYESYRNQWVIDHIDNSIKEETLEQYKNRESTEEHWTFEEFVDEYGYADGSAPVCFDEWYDNEYEGELTTGKEVNW